MMPSRLAEEKTCYVALSPSKEEKEASNRGEDFRLPDGNVIRVRNNLGFYLHQGSLGDAPL